MAKRSVNGIETDITWIKKSLDRIEKNFDAIDKKMDNFANKLERITNWKAKIIGISIGGSAGISLLISLLKLFKR